MKMNIGRKITTWVRKVVVLVLACLIIYQPAFAAHIPITIEEEDGTPSLANIKTIQVAPNKLTSLGNGALLLNVNGDITAAANFTDNRLIKADGTAGLESSGITISDTDNISGVVDFTSTGNASIGGTLGVTGAVSLTDTLAVTGAATFSSTADITGNATVGGTLGVTGATTLSSTLGVTGAATFSSTTNTTGNATMNANVLIADGQAAPSADANFGKIYVNGDNLYYLPANVAAEPFLLNNGGAAVPGADNQVVFNSNGALAAEAAFTYNNNTDTLQVDGTINGSAVTADDLTVTGDVNINGSDVDITAANSVDITTTNVGITANVNMTGTFNLTGDLTASGTVTGLLVQGTTVNGDTVTGDALTITGASTFTGNVGITGNTTQTGDIDLTGNSTFTGTFDITGATTITGATSITGTLTASDDFTVDTSTLFVDASANQVGIGTTSTVELLTVNGITAMAESSAPSATAGYGKLYVKSDSQLYYMDGSGVEQALSTSATAISTKTADYTIVSSDYSILGNAASESITISLPAAASYTGRMFVIKKVDSSANLVTIDPNGAETIDGASTYDLNVQWEAIQVQSNGTSWFVL